MRGRDRRMNNEGATKQSDTLPLNLLALPLCCRADGASPAAIVVNKVYLALMVLENTVQHNFLCVTTERDERGDQKRSGRGRRRGAISAQMKSDRKGRGAIGAGGMFADRAPPFKE